MNIRTALIAVAVLLGSLSTWDPRVSVFAFLGVAIALAATTRLEKARARAPQIALGISLLVVSWDLYRFARKDAMQGISEARERESAGRAVSRLREILFAEDAMRRYAFVDPDGDHVGSAGFLAEMTGARPLRSGGPLEHPPLTPRFTPRLLTSSGAAAEEDGYLYLVCLPKAGGGFTGHATDRINEEEAERKFLAYAWPTDRTTHPGGRIYAIDQDERIWESSRQVAGRYVGRSTPPPCSLVLDPGAAGSFAPWRGKKPRKAPVGALAINL